MPKLPIVAIIGRPNTGKSTLFNRMIGKRQAIVSDVPGTTRDHVAHRVEADEMDYLLLDTGGMGGGTEDKDFEDDVHAQSLLAVEAADVIVLTLSSREELTGSDRELAVLLRKRKRRHVPIIIAVTKADNEEKAEEVIHDFHELQIADEIIPLSAIHGMGMDELEQAIIDHLKQLHFQKETQDSQLETHDFPRIALIGKPNVGKSSILNALMSDEQRSTSPRIVSEVPGTTRDTTDTVIRHEDKEYLFVDTAGLRRPSHVEEGIEHFAVLRTITAVEDADVVILVVDAIEVVSHQDKRIARMAMEQGKALIILVNKIDQLSGAKKKERVEAVQESLFFCHFAPILSCSATTREGLPKIFPLIELVYRNRLRRIPTKELHYWLRMTLDGQSMGMLGTAKHITQAEELPPTFVLFVKDPRKVELSQLRFLDKRLRSTFDFTGTPIRWVTKSSERDDR